MMGIERLRDIVDDGPYSGGMVHISVQKLREICEQIESETVEALAFVREHGGLDEVKKRLMPDGYSWPAFEDGDPVEFGDEFQNAHGGASVLRTVLINDCRDSLGGDFYWKLGKGKNAVTLKNGERVKRPEPKVLDADGAEVRIGDEVWSTVGCFDGKRTVRSIHVDEGEPPYAFFDFEEGCEPWSFPCCCLTHRAPVLAADGKPLREGDTVWDTIGNGPYNIQKIENDGVIRIDGSDLDYFGYEFVRERPDSWERWIEDADKSSCEYFGSFGTSCDGCQHDPCMCDNDKNRDLVRRAKVLAGRGE